MKHSLSIPPGQYADAIEKAAPDAPECEFAVLGCILVNPTCLPAVRLILPSADWFMRPRNGTVYAAMIETAQAAEGALDVVLLNQKLEDTGLIKGAGGVDYLLELAQAFPSSSNVRHYAKQVRLKHLTFLAFCAAGDLLHDMHNAPDESAFERIGETIEKLTEINRLWFGTASASPP